MNYWIIVDDHHDGPHSIDTLVANGLKPEDLVWTEGLTDWTAAANVAELAEAIRLRDLVVSEPAEGEMIEIVEVTAPATDPVPAEEEAPAADGYPAQQEAPLEQTTAPRQGAVPQYAHTPQYAATPQYAQAAQNGGAMVMEPCPPAYIAWSIIVTLLCCTIVGIPAIIFASLTKSHYYKGNLAKAKRYSELAQWFIIGAIVAGAVGWPFQLALMSL